MKNKFIILGVIIISMLAMSINTYAAEEYFDLSIYQKEDYHEDVKLLQMALMLDGVFSHDAITDYFGPKTETSVKAFQEKYDLEADGIVGHSTVEKIQELNLLPVLSKNVYKTGDELVDVQYIQLALKMLGYYDYDEITSFYGENTRAAVKRFQEDKGLGVDGIIGKKTIVALRKTGLVTSQLIDEPVGSVSLSLYEEGMDHEDIKTLQKVLKEEHVFSYDGYTSHFGKVTKEAVIAFQEKYGLEADGVVGQTTINKMLELGYVTREQTIVASRSASTSNAHYGEYISWYDMKKIFTPKKSKIVVKDFYTGKTFEAMVSYGSNHADIEPLTKAQTNIVKSFYGGDFSWARRPVLVYYKDRVFAGSMNGMPHAGLENKPEGEYVSNRSGGFGYGYNFDFIKGNGMSGHFCLHFKDSLLHKNNARDRKHQEAVKIAAGRK